MIFPNLNTLPDHYGTASKQPVSHRRHRSNMMLNPLNLKHLNRLDELSADVVTLNLEDAIAPSRKKEALHNIALFLSHLSYSPAKIVVRINPLDQGGEEEIRFLNDFGFEAVRIPKVQSPKEIERALSILSEDKELHFSLETKEAFSQIGSLKIDERVTTANLGILDLLTSLGLPQSLVTLGNPTIDYILTKFLIESKTAGIGPVSFMYQAYGDLEGFKAWCNRERQLGFRSKACMGPKQVHIANAIFGCDEAELQKGYRIIRRFEEESKRGNNGFYDEAIGLFIDEPIYRDALLKIQDCGENDAT